MAPVDQAAEAVACADTVVRRGIATLAGAEGGADRHQVLAYDVAHAAAAAATAHAALAYGERGELEARIACAFVADVVADLAARLVGRDRLWGADPSELSPAAAFVTRHRDPQTLADLCGNEGPRHLADEFELARETFHRFAENEIRPHAEHVHRNNSDIPESIIGGLAELGGFGMSVP